MNSGKINNQTVGGRGTSPYTNVPTGAGGTANYPSGQKVGYGYEAGKDVNSANYPDSQKAGFVNPQQRDGYGGEYVQRTPVTYGPDGTPVTYGPDGTPVKKNSRLRNLVVGALAVACCCIIC